MSPLAPAHAPCPLLTVLGCTSEYYFSASNLERDVYMRSIMDDHGFVQLLEIIKFRRMVNLCATADMVSRAVSMSSACC